MRERDFQSKVVKFLRGHGCIVAKMQAGPGVPKGTADLFWCYKKVYGWIEVKASGSAEKQIGQREFLALMDKWGVFARLVSPENWGSIQEEIVALLEEAK